MPTKHWSKIPTGAAVVVVAVAVVVVVVELAIYQ